MVDKSRRWAIDNVVIAGVPRNWRWFALKSFIDWETRKKANFSDFLVDCNDSFSTYCCFIDIANNIHNRVFFLKCVAVNIAQAMAKRKIRTHTFLTNIFPLVSVSNRKWADQTTAIVSKGEWRGNCGKGEGKGGREERRVLVHTSRTLSLPLCTFATGDCLSRLDEAKRSNLNSFFGFNYCDSLRGELLSRTFIKYFIDRILNCTFL